MFYSELILTKKGPLAKVWLAAHWDKKLDKKAIASLSLEKSVKSIVDPKVPIALRTNGHLLLGVVKIYSRKVKYMLAECNETLTKIKLQARTKDVADENINMPVQHTTATKNQITMPEVSDLDLLLLPNAAEITLELGDNWQSKIQDITLIDYAAWTTEESIEPSLEIQVEAATTPTPKSIEAQRAASTGIPTTGGVTTLGTDKAFEGGVDIEQILPELGGITTPPGGISPGGFGPMEIGGFEMGEMPGIAPTPGGVTIEAEKPAEEEEEAPTKKRKRKPGKLIFDEPSLFETGYYTKRLKEHHELLTERHRAPTTREEYEQLGRTATSKDIWKQPPSMLDLPLGFMELWNSTLTPAGKEKPTEEEREQERERATPTVPTSIGVTPIEMGMPMEIGGFEPGMEIGGFEMAETPAAMGRPRTTMGPVELGYIEPGELEQEMDEMLLSAGQRKEKTPLTDQQKKRIIEDKNRIEKELREKAAATPQVGPRGITAPSPAGVTERTVKVLAMLEEGFNQTGSDELSLTEMLKGRKRQTAARCFYETLVLKSKGLIDVSQEKPFAEIKIIKV